MGAAGFVNDPFGQPLNPTTGAVDVSATRALRSHDMFVPTCDSQALRFGFQRGNKVGESGPSWSRT